MDKAERVEFLVRNLVVFTMKDAKTDRAGKEAKAGTVQPPRLRSAPAGGQCDDTTNGGNDADDNVCDWPEQHRTGELPLEQSTAGTPPTDSTCTNVDFQHSTSLVTKLIEQTEEIKTEALDRERRLIRHIDDLKREVSTLSAALEEEKRRTTKRRKN